MIAVILFLLISSPIHAAETKRIESYNISARSLGQDIDEAPWGVVTNEALQFDVPCFVGLSGNVTCFGPLRVHSKKCLHANTTSTVTYTKCSTSSRQIWSWIYRGSKPVFIRNKYTGTYLTLESDKRGIRLRGISGSRWQQWLLK